jgi:hypothetical protein
MTARRILICLHDFHRGGTERIALGLARAWTEAGREVTILCGSTEGGLREEVDSRVRVVPLDPPVRRSLFSRFRLARAMARRLDSLQPDIIFLPGNFHAAGADRAQDFQSARSGRAPGGWYFSTAHARRHRICRHEPGVAAPAAGDAAWPQYRRPA